LNNFVRNLFITKSSDPMSVGQ